MRFLPQLTVPKSDWLKRLDVQLGLVFSLIILLRFFPAIFQGKALIFGDNYSLMVPGKLFTVHWLKKGVLPLWNPTILGGIPWIGDVNQSVLYPSTLLFTWLSPAAALNWTVSLHLLLTFVGMYFLAKRWLKAQDNRHFLALIAAVLWTLSTQVTGSINNLSTVQSLSWMPWAIYFGLRISKSFKAKCWFAAMVFLQFAAGYPQFVIYSILAAVFLESVRELKKNCFYEWLKHWTLTAIMSVSLSALIWLPFLKVLSGSTRSIQSGEQALMGSLHPAELIKIILPSFFDSPSQGMKWGPSWNSMPNVAFYVSWFGLLILAYFLFLALRKKISLNKESLLLSGSVLTGITFSLGKYLPVDLSWLLLSSRGPSLILTVVNLLLVLAVVDFWSKLKPKKVLINTISRTKLGLLWVFIASLLLSSVLIYRFDSLWRVGDGLLNNSLTASSFHTLARDKIIVRTIVVNFLVNFLLFLTQVWILSRKKVSKIANPIFLVFLVIEMTFNTQAMLFFAPNKVYSVEEPAFDMADPQARWLIRNSNVPYTDYNSFWEALVVRKPFSDSFVDQEQLKTFDHLSALKKGQTPDWNMPHDTQTLNGYTTLLPSDVNRIWNQTNKVGINGLPQIDLDNPLLQDWAVKYYLVDNWFEIEEDLARLKLVDKKDRWTLYQLPALPRFRYEDGTAVSLNQESQELTETPNQIKISLINDDDRDYLIVADRYDSDWQAEVNGQPVKVENFNQMRRIPIQSGLNRIELKYRPSYFFLGLGISGTFLLLVISGSFYQRTRASKQERD